MPHGGGELAGGAGSEVAQVVLHHRPGARTGGQEVTRAPQPGREIPVALISGGVLARMRPDLSIGAALPPPGRQRPGSGSPGAWHVRAAGATMRGWLVMTAGPSCGGWP